MPPQNAVGMDDMVTEEFIPWKNRIKIRNNKCHRHDRFGNRGIYSVENESKSATTNAVGMTDIVTVEFIPWKTNYKSAQQMP